MFAHRARAVRSAAVTVGRGAGRSVSIWRVPETDQENASKARGRLSLTGYTVLVTFDGPMRRVRSGPVMMAGSACRDAYRGPIAALGKAHPG